MRLKNIDYRLLLGLALVAASMTGVVSLIAALDKSQAVYVALRPIASGELISEGMLGVEHINLGRVSGEYLVPANEFSPTRAVRPIDKGELIPLRSLGNSAPDIVNAVVRVSGPLPANLSAGSIVDVWAARNSSAGTEQPAEAVASDVEVVALREPSGFNASAGNDVEIRVPRAKLAGLLDAIARGDYISVVRVAR